MDYIRLGQTALAGPDTRNVSNSSAEHGQIMPKTLIDAIIPGYSLIHAFIHHYFNIDVSVLVSITAFLYGAYYALTRAWRALLNVFNNTLQSTIHINDQDDLFETINEWLAEQSTIRNARTLRATTNARNQYRYDEDDEPDVPIAATSPEGYFNYGSWQANIPPRYEVFSGTHRIRHKGRYFAVSRQEKNQQSAGYWNDASQEYLEISCVSWTTAPIKSLIQDIKLGSTNNKKDMTSVRNAPSTDRWNGSGWSRPRSRPSRPLNTVILDEEQKRLIVEDMNDFLHPETPAWYAARGIPYRRGYLLYGPPGTGKTSLSFALAGIFGLDLYCFSLNDPKLLESDLRELFAGLPRRCVVLLEDIDQAGIKRPDKFIERKRNRALKELTEKDEKSVIIKDDKAGEISEESKDTNGLKSQPMPSNTDVDVKSENLDEKVEVKPENLEEKVEVKPVITNGDHVTNPPVEPDNNTNWTLQDLARAIMAVSAERTKAVSEESNVQPSKSEDNDTNNSKNNNNDDHANSSDEDYDDDDTDEDEMTRDGRRQERNRKKSSKKGEGISLSGLLNAIDGVSTSEGRVLIMTTNYIEDLDAALIRTGRIDMRIQFSNATKEQSKELFSRMYAVDFKTVSTSTTIAPRRVQLDVFSGVVGKSEKGKPCLLIMEKGGDDTVVREMSADVVHDKILQLAAQFSAAIPEQIFSPSDIQGYLLLHKRTPLAAVEGVCQWVESEISKRKTRAEKSKARQERRDKKKQMTINK